MKIILNTICYNFGFDDFKALTCSLVHKEFALLSIISATTLSSIGYFFEERTGLTSGALVAFSALVGLELLTGLLASKKRGIKIESRKFSRFGLKLLVWLVLFYILNEFREQYVHSSVVAYEVYDWLHIFVVGYVIMEYLISVLENLGTITGKDYTRLIGIIKKKLGGIDSPMVQNLEDYLVDSAESLHIVDARGTIVWANRTELAFLGYTEEEYVGKSITSFHRDPDVIIDILSRLLANETLTNYSAYLIAKDGSEKRVLINSSGYWKDKQFIHTRCFTRDVTDLPLPEGTGYINTDNK